MSISRRQQILIKRAQREAHLNDADYRDALEAVSGLRSSTDPRMTDRHVDLALAYFEAIYWRAIDAGQLQPSGKLDAVFRQRRFWACRNTKDETSRDRFTAHNLGYEIAALESQLSALGYGSEYCAAIRENVTHGRDYAHARHLYKAALARTLRAKRNQNFSRHKVAS